MTNYRKAGVDIKAGNELVRRIKPLVRSTFRHEVLTDIGGFGGLFQFATNKYVDPVLVSSTDGVGTKLKIAFMMDKHDTIGIDLVAMCVNDVLVSGAEPLFFLDYFSTGKLTVEKAEAVVSGIAEGCRMAGCALIGGETAEMPSFYPEGEYDLAGFTVGVVDRSKLIDGSSIESGDVLVGLSSSGLHSNGYSLIRRIFFDQAGLHVDSRMPELNASLGEILLTPTRIYVKSVLALLSEFSVKGIVHITGGGLSENLPRIFSQQCKARISLDAWPIPRIFQVVQNMGKVDEQEMLRVFNMGIGMVLIVSKDSVSKVIARAVELGEQGFQIGEIVSRNSQEQSVEYVGSIAKT